MILTFSFLTASSSNLHQGFQIFLHLFERQRNSEQDRDLPSTGLCPKCLQQPELCQGKARSPELEYPTWVAGTQLSTCCLPGCASAISWNWKQSELEPWNSDLGCRCAKWHLTHCTKHTLPWCFQLLLKSYLKELSPHGMVG